MPVITALYAGILGLFFIYLAFGAGSLRGKLGVSIGDGGHPELLLAMRKHANFVEFVPLALILIALLELNGVSSNAIHALGATLVVARVAHPFGLDPESMANPLRAVGAAGSTLVIAVASVWAIVTFF